MTYITICFICIAALAIIAVLLRMGAISFNIKPLALIIGIAAFVLFYLAQSNGEIHTLSVRMAEKIVKGVQWFCSLAR